MVGSAPGGYDHTAWMKLFGGVPTEYQEDAYLNQVAASTNQKTIIAAARGTANHKLSIDKIKDLLTANA